MARRMAFGVLMILVSAMVLLPAGAAAQTAVLSDRAAPETTKPGELPPGKEPPNEKPGLPLNFPAGIQAVATGYTWSQTTGTYTEISGGTVHGNAGNDDTSFNAVTLGFTFSFDGFDFTQVSIQSNGFIAMGATVSNSYTPLSTGSSNNVIVAIGRDLQGNGTTAELMSLMEGTAPNRVFTVQWKHYKRYGTAYAGDDFNFQIKLYETSNVVEVVYGTFTVVAAATPPTIQVGLRGASNADFNNRSGTGAWTSSAAGTLNNATMALTDVYYPPSGLTWDWTPIPPSPSFVTSTKTAPGSVVIGNPIAYTVSIVNSGTAPAGAATMVDPIPAGTTYNADVTCSAGTCGFDGTNVTWSGSVAVGATVTVSFSVDTDGAPCGEMALNEATLADPGLPGGPVTRSVLTELVSSTPAPLDGFETSVPPPGWTETVVNDPGTDPDWTRETAGTNPTIAPHGGTAMARFNSFTCPANASARLWTSALDLSGYAAPAVVFWMSHDTGYASNADRVQVQVSLDGTTWVDVAEPILRYDASYTTPGWGEHVVVLPSGTNVNGVYIGFLGTSAYGNNFYLDDTALAEGWYPCPYTSLTPDGARTVCPGGTVTYPLTLSNMTPNADTFDLTVAGNAWPTTPSSAQLVLGPGASGSVTVGVDVPWTPGSDTATVTALGQTHAGTDTATLATTASSTHWGAIASEPDNGRMDNVLGAWDDKVWSITGYGANLQVRSYDPATDAWTVVGTPPTFGGNYARSGCQAGSKVYMYGDATTPGFTGLWSYDMATTTWAQETPGGTAPVQTGIWAPAWAADAETGYCYLTGGATAAGAGNLTTVYVYDPATNAWLTPLPNFTSVRDYHAAWVFRDATNRKLLCVAGGNNGAGMASTQCYAFAAATWGAENADIGPLPADLWGMGYAQKVHEGATQLWVTAGVRAGSLTAATSFFDVAAGVWADDGNLPSGAVYRTSAVISDNEIYNLGGSIGSFSYTGVASRHIQCGAPPNIDVSPASVVSSQNPNTVTSHPLTVANTGQSPLNWELFEQPLSAPAPTRPNPLVAPFDSNAARANEIEGIEVASDGPSQMSSRATRARALRMLLSTGLLLVPDSTNDRIMAFDPITGNVVDANFIPNPGGIGTGVHAILSSGGDSILLSDQTGDVVHEFGLDGTYLGVFAPAGGANTAILDNIRGMSLDATGHLLVTVASGTNTDAIARFDTGGTFTGNFIAPGVGGLDSPFDIYARASDWLAGGIDSDAIHRYDLTGAYIANLSAINTFPEQIAEATNGNVLVANFSGTQEGVIELTSTGTLVGVYNPSALGGYRGVYELPNGNILTTTGTGVHEISRGGALVESKITGVSGRFIEYVVLQTDCTSLADVPWLSATPASGTTTGGASTPISVSLDSTGLSPATYSANLCVFSNDPDAGPGNGTELVVVPVTLTVTSPYTPSISLTKTVGTIPGTCAATTEITVPAGTEVYYCYQAQNTGDVALTIHDLVDSELGSVLIAFSHTLAPGAYSPQVIVPATVGATVTNTATWTAYNAGPIDVATAEASATVNVVFPNIDVAPLSMTSTQPPDTTSSQTLSIGNTGQAPLDWQVIEAQPTRPIREGVVAAPEPVFNVPAIVSSPADCAAFANYPGREPQGYAQHCQPEGGTNAAPGAGVLAPTSTGYAQDIGYVSDNFVRFTLNNFPGQTVQGTSTNAYYGMDFDATGTTLYALNDTTDELGTINLTDGTFTAIVSCPEPGGTSWTGLSIDPVSNLFYASTAANLYTLDPATCSPQLVGPFGISGGIMIDIAIGPSGVMYGHDIVTDSIYTINTTTGAATLVGVTGYNANYAQGMDFDNEDETLYIFLYVGSGVNHYGTVNLATGAVTPLASSNPTGEFEGATQTVAMCVPTDHAWLSATPTSGTTAASGSTPVQVTFDSTGLAPASYDGQLCVRSNDPDLGPGNGTNLVAVPVSLTVTEQPVPAITLLKTVGTTNGVCAATSAITVAPGTTVYYCYTVTNTGNVTLNLHDLVDDQLGTLFTGLNYALTPGGSVNTVAAGLSIPAVINTTTTNTATWTAYNAGPTDSTTAQASATVTVVGTPAITLVKTVGTTNGVCAATSSISVTAGTTVYYCYEVTNTGNVTLNLHGLVDDQLGAIFSGLAYTLTPGSSVDTVAAGLSIPAVINTTTTNTATWTAYNAGPTDSTTAQASATVTALQPANVSGSKTVSGTYVRGGTITYTIILTNAGPGPQPDDPASDEFVDVLPASLTATGASASTGSVLRVGNQVTWNGVIPAGGSVTITITATINPVPGGTVIANQGTINFDGTGDGINDSSRLTDDPVPPGAADPTVFTVTLADPIPTLGSMGLLLLILLLAGVAVAYLRRIA